MGDYTCKHGRPEVACYACATSLELLRDIILDEFGGEEPTVREMERNGWLVPFREQYSRWKEEER